MSTYIQVNIYNQTLEVLKMRGLDLQSILKTIGCPDTWITEVPIITSPQVAPKPSTPPPVPKVSIAPPTMSHSFPTDPMHQLRRPFKSISAEIGRVEPLILNDALRTSPMPGPSQPRKRTASGIRGLFDDWDPTANLEAPATSSTPPANESKESTLKVPKEEIMNETEELNETTVLDEHELAAERERNLLDELFQQDRSNMVVEKSKSADDVETTNMNYVISCNYPNCGLKYNWRVKYGKLRLFDHAMTHSNRKIPCKLCGFECTNISRMRAHYTKAHPTERMEGYGMKSLVSGADGDSDTQVGEEELKELWNTCYSDSIHLVGHATGFVDGEKFRRMTKSRKMEREVRSSIAAIYNPNNTKGNI
ncbi:Protein CBG02957 [Caenorhabditis briggsae]|uniref:Protein CBG02957 n=1 Tax=Caenorhabditis briggsae TaxID=6238 RepID=A8WT44_CAEBR|nr:Protein CBG02957 [Caenorhabditis briggsae]CAP23655.1 Protein CBG02957 [Caenorhabditis briggsae]